MRLFHHAMQVLAGLSLHALPQPLKLGIGLNSLLGEGIVEPPLHQRRHGGEAGGDHLFELGVVDGQQRLARCAEQLICKGEAQRCGAARVPAEIFFISVLAFLGRLGPLLEDVDCLGDGCRIGSPIRPAFSTMEMASLAEKPMIAASHRQNCRR